MVCIGIKHVWYYGLVHGSSRLVLLIYGIQYLVLSIGVWYLVSGILRLFCYFILVPNTVFAAWYFFVYTWYPVFIPISDLGVGICLIL